MKKNLLKTVCIALVAVLYAMSLNAQNAVVPSTVLHSMDLIPHEYVAPTGEQPNMPAMFILPSGNTAYAHNNYGSPAGYVKYNVGTPTAQTSLAGTLYVYGGDMVYDVLYTYTGDQGGYSPGTFLKINSLTGAILQTIPGAWVEFMSDMAYDHSTHTMYGTKNGILYKVNIETGAAMQVATITGLATAFLITLAVNFEGDMYGINVNASGISNLYKINKETGVATLIGPTGKSANYAQSMGFDHNDGTLYWPQCSAIDDMNFMSVNITTGNATLIANTGCEQMCFHVWFEAPAPPACDPASDLLVEYTSDCKAILSWTGHAEALTYNVFRNGVQIANVSETTYTDVTFDPARDYTWEIKAVCDIGPSPETVSFTKEACTNCPAVSSFQVQVEDSGDDCSAYLTWNELPSLFEGEIMQNFDEMAGKVGGYSNAESDFIPAFRFTARDLADLGVTNGQLLTKLRFGVGEMDLVTTMEVRVWVGGTSYTDPGQLVYNQPVANYLDFVEGDMVDIDIVPPIVIDATKELRIGCRIVVGPGGYPFVSDDGPGFKEKGNIMFWANMWRETETVYGSDFNWAMKAVIEAGSATAPDWRYNIYRDGDLIKEAHAETFYVDNGIDLDPHTWMVKVHCLVPGLSHPAMVTAQCIQSVKETVKTGFSIAPNPAKDKITISATSDFNKVEVINFLGQIVIAQSNNGEKAEINVSNLTNGVYFVRVISENGASVQKFVKQ
jgi:hypothetical protein